MGTIVKKILNIFGWQNLLMWTWEAIHPSLHELVEKTDTRIDDDMLNFIDRLIEELVNNGDINGN